MFGYAAAYVHSFCMSYCVERHVKPLHTRQQKKLAYLGFQCLDHPPCSPCLAPSEYHLFLGLKKQLKVRHFSSYAEVIPAAEILLDIQPSNFFFFLVACKS
jgi:hypothetical protein